MVGTVLQNIGFSFEHKTVMWTVIWELIQRCGGDIPSLGENFVPFIKIMLYIPKIDDYLKILTNEEMKYFAAISFSEHFQSIGQEQNLRNVAKLLYIVLTTPNKVEKHVQSISADNCLHHYNVENLKISFFSHFVFSYILKCIS